MNTASAFTHPDPALLAGPAIHAEVQQFLFREALLLDHERYEEWLGLLTQDVHYRTPTRFARAIGIEPPLDAPFFEDDHPSLASRVCELRKRDRLPATGGAGADNTTCRRFVTNVIVSPRNRGEYDVLSYVLITRAAASGECGFVTAERYDQLRRAANSFKISRREIVVDQRTAAAGAVDLFL